MFTDLDLKRNVIEELEWEPSLDAANINVAVHNGAVTLTGYVASLAEKQTAERVIKRVQGVKAVAQEIEVRLPHDKKAADDQIAERAMRVLDWNTSIPTGQMQISVLHGQVTLSGEVDWQYQKELAESDVEKLSGVVRVINVITVKSRVRPEDVHTKIEAALKRSAELDAGTITVRTDGGRVILGGKVKAWYERDIAQRAAWSAPGVTAVEDNITLG